MAASILLRRVEGLAFSMAATSTGRSVSGTSAGVVRGGMDGGSGMFGRGMHTQTQRAAEREAQRVLSGYGKRFMSLQMDARRLAKNREQVRAFNTGAYARLEKLFQPSRQAAQRKLQNVREEVEEFQDRLKFVLAGLKRGELQFTPQLIPILLKSDKVPKGFENFFPKGDKGPTAATDTASESSSESPAAEKGSSGKEEESKGWGSGGGGGKKDGDGNGMPQMPGPPQMLAALALVVLFLMMMGMGMRNDGREINFQEFLNSLLVDGRVDHLQVINQRIVRVFLKESAGAGDSASQYYFTVGSIDSFERKLEQSQYDLGLEQKDFVAVVYSNETSWGIELLKFAPTILIMGIFFLVMRQMGGGMGGGAGGGPGNIFKVGKAKPTIVKPGDAKDKIMFKDVAGLHEAKIEVVEFVEFLRNPDKFKALGAKIPKGALLCGPPGTGKTLLAKAMSGEANVPFLSMSGSDFIEMFVGVGASRVRDLFAQARAQAPCIVFIDEIDAVGRARGRGGAAGGNDERENTLNQLLVEMDGFNPLTGIIVLAGTNRADILDPALLRPGRFDRQVQIDKPDIRGRVEIYMVHLKNLKLCDPIEEIAKRMASLTPGFSGADIANVCNEAALIAARNSKVVVSLIEFESAIERVIGGIEKTSKILTKEERRTVAYHEAGHAVCGWFLEHADPLLKVSIVPRGGGALGYNQFLPREAALYSEEQLLDTMCMALGGRVAEEVVFKRITTGASDDLDRVTKMAYSQVTVYGFNAKIGVLSYQDRTGNDQFKKPYSEATAQMIDEEARSLVKGAYERTTKLIVDKRAQLELLAERLLEREMLTHNDVLELLGPRPFEMNDHYKEYVDTSSKWRDQAKDQTVLPTSTATAAATPVAPP